MCSLSQSGVRVVTTQIEALRIVDDGIWLVREARHAERPAHAMRQP